MKLEHAEESIILPVTLNDTLVDNGSFESPTTGDYVYTPTDSTWSYVTPSGLVHNGSAFGNADAPDGVQAAFVQQNGVISQTFTTGGGTFTLAFMAAQRGNFNPTFQKLRVTVQPYPLNTIVKTFLWCGNQICEERDAAGGTVKKRFFAEGEQRIGGSDAGNYYYSRDHLGSIREVTDSTGALKAQYDYDAWGNEVVVSGNMNVDFGFTGHYFHQPSGMNLALYRAYNPTLGRWISRDPIGENGGINLYEYVSNDPISRNDPLGLWPTQSGTDDPTYNCMAYALCQKIWLPLPQSNAPPTAIPPRYGCRVVTCGTSCDSCKHEHKVVLIEDSLDAGGWHVYRQGPGAGYSCKYGQLGIGCGLNPIQDYKNVYRPTGILKLTCWCCPD